MALITPAYHFGLVVPDLERAQDELARALGLSWAKTQQREVLTDTAAGRRGVDITFAYSLEGPPYLELLERRDDSIFDHVGLHHIGVWSDDPSAESVRLSGEGFPRESVNVKPDGTWTSGLFHTGGCGLRVEVVDIGTSGPRLAQYLAGGDYAPRT
jgi:hypothetical protein